jgi:hypothetical protein
VATDVRLSDVAAFIRDHLDADAALSIAALGEPDDDTYLAAAALAKSFYAPAGTALGPFEGRWATPGGRLRRPPIDATAKVRPAALYAVGDAGPGAWLALVGESRDVDAMFIANALLVKQTGDGLRITGRAAVDPFADELVFEPAGGEAVDLGAAEHPTIFQEPTAARHAAFLRGWAQT